MAPDKPAAVSLYQQPDQAGLTLDSRFTFQCHAGLACFNRCCRTPTIVLSPYDILCLKQHLGITSGEFLRRYTLRETEARSHLPLIFMDAFRSPEGGCPFLGPQGCTVYARRPAACRLFPITMGSQLTNEGVVDHYFCRRLEYCRGFDRGEEWTLASWIANQGFEEYDRGRKEWIEILLKEGLKEPLAVDAPLQDLIAILAYDLDRFRRLIAEPAFLEIYPLDAQIVEELQADDLALLKFSYRVLHSVLFEDGMDRMKRALGSLIRAEEID
ncbi:MAG: YkgJ family cysteine cluster protein [Desulfobaccales bacterium]